MNETEKNNNEVENNKLDIKKELLRFVRQGSRCLPGVLGGLIPISLVTIAGALLGFGVLVEIVSHQDSLSVTSIMAGLLFLLFGLSGLAKQAHALFLRLLAGGEK